MKQADSDGLPTMGQQAESDIAAMKCTCGQPNDAGVMHRYDGHPCIVEYGIDLGAATEEGEPT